MSERIGDFAVRDAVSGDLDVAYFLQAVDGGAIKIGHSGTFSGAESRLSSCQTGNPHELRLLRVVVLTCDGRRVRSEPPLHHYFAPYLVRGEWFLPCPELVALTGADTSESPTHEMLVATAARKAGYSEGLCDGFDQGIQEARGYIGKFFDQWAVAA